MSGIALDAQALVTTYLEQTRFVHMVRFGQEGAIEFVNDAMATHLGVVGSALRGRPVFDYLTEHDAALVKERLGRPPKASEPVNLNFCDAEGVPFTLSSYIAVYPDGCLLIGEPTYHDEQRLQRQLLEVNEELAGLARTRHRSTIDAQRARLEAEGDNRAKDQALAMIAHELRQPLNGAVAALGVLKQNPAASAKAQLVLERQITHMATLVEDLLNASRVMRGVIELNRERMDLRPIVREAIDLNEAAARERGHEVTLVAADEPLEVFADVTRLRQVFLNLLTNATKYTPDGGSIVISIERGEGSTGRVRVRDTGEGIPAHQLDVIFDLFVRATRGGNGLGIGLAVVKRLVEVHDGGITVASEGPGRGSEFSVTLPLVQATAPVG